mgnify:CR=1 FL=1
MNVPFPLTFRIFNEAKNTFTTAGAPEFDAECDGIVMPYWVGDTPQWLPECNHLPNMLVRIVLFVAFGAG